MPLRFVFLLINLGQDVFLILERQLKSFLTTTPPKRWENGTKGDIVLLPGFAETWVFLETCANYLNQLGYRIHVVNTLGRSVDPMDVAVARIKQYIRETDLQEITFLSHSKGGIIAKMLLDDSIFAKRIKRSISLAAPYGGTAWGHLRVFSLHEHLPRAMETLRVQALTSQNHKVINLYPKLDNNVIPNKNLLLRGAENIRIDVIGHTRILEAQETLRVLGKILK